jgi:error-prone DNA polymerase
MANSRTSVLLEQALAAQLPSYAELHCLTNFSFLRGASHPHELVEQAMSRGYSALAITDECSLAGVVRAHTAVREIKQERDRQQKEREDKTKAAQAGTSVEEAAKSTAT